LIIASCGSNNESKEYTIVNSFYDKEKEIIEYKAYYNDEKLKTILGYSMDGDLVDSLYRVNDNVNYKILNEDLHVNDTITIKLDFKNSPFEDSYVMLTDSVIVEDILYQNDYLYSNYNGKVELKFILSNSGKNNVTGILFNTSVQVLKYINEDEFIGKRVGMFEEFDVEFDVDSL
jgi:hypothetical protein